MTFDTLLSRADDETLQQLVGQPALRLIGTLDPSLLVPANLREVVLGLYGRESLLASFESRRLLIDLLRPKEAEQLAAVLQIPPGGDVYEALKETRFRKGSNREALLFAFFNLDVPHEEAADEAPALTSGSTGYGLFAHQRRAARQVQDKLAHFPYQVVLHMPTGSGKTRTAMNVIAEHLRSTEPRLVVWLAYGEELCEQAAAEFERAWYHLGNRQVNVHRFWGNRSLVLDHVRDGIIIASLAKLYSAAKQSIDFIGKLSSRSTLVIIDEAHQSIARTYRFVLEALLALRPGTGLLGLTATPGRTYSDIEEDEALARFFGKQKVMLTVDEYDNPITYLTDHGYLSKVSFDSLFIEGGLDLSATDLQLIRDGLDLPDSVLQRLAEDDKRNLSIIYRLEELGKRHRRILVFATTVQHSNLLATVLQARGWTAGSVTAQTPSAERTRLIDAFKHGSQEPMFLCNYGVLTTGFDAPQTSAALIARPTKSLVLYSQMVGRAIRGPKAGGNPEAEVVTVVDTALPGFGSVVEAFTNWEDVWE